LSAEGKYKLGMFEKGMLLRIQEGDVTGEWRNFVELAIFYYTSQNIRLPLFSQ
jgi:hypothetical protein